MSDSQRVLPTRRAWPRGRGGPHPPAGPGRRSGPPWRSRADRVLTGLAGGVAEWSGLPPLVVRVAFVVLGASTGLGVLAYVVGSFVVPVADASVPADQRRLDLRRGADLEQAIAVGLVLLGATLLLRRLGLRFGGNLAVPGGLLGVGFAVVWSRTNLERREQWRSRVAQLPSAPAGSATRRALLVRLVAGGVLLLAGGGAFLARADPSALGQVLVAMAVTAAGLGLLVGPWILSLWRDLADERRDRIRSEELAELAAHLHDSVLQTLVLVQRNPETPRDVALLVRRQERELRGWLYPAGPRRSRADAAAAEAAPPTIATAIRATVTEVEEQHAVEVDVVTVGDAPLDERLDALAKAAREALVNAARHSGAPEISVYLEVTPATASVYVRDRGCGFDPSAVPPDRHGLRDSVTARMARHEGTAVITSAVGEGTEVVLEVPR